MILGVKKVSKKGQKMRKKGGKRGKNLLHK